MNINPKVAAELPASLIGELLIVHSEIEAFKADEMEKSMNKAKG